MTRIIQGEALLLAGGSSRRMGFDKASIIIEGERLDRRLCRLLDSASWRVTVLGGKGVEGFDFLPDQQTGQGPLAALQGFVPGHEHIFVLACDVPLFRPELACVMARVIGSQQAVIPELEGRLQPLCALYKSSSFCELGKVPSGRIMDWVNRLSYLALPEESINDLGCDPAWAKGVNSQDELGRLLESRPSS